MRSVAPRFAESMASCIEPWEQAPPIQVQEWQHPLSQIWLGLVVQSERFVQRRHWRFLPRLCSGWNAVSMPARGGCGHNSQQAAARAARREHLADLVEAIGVHSKVSRNARYPRQWRRDARLAQSPSPVVCVKKCTYRKNSVEHWRRTRAIQLPVSSPIDQ
jgi:hypothetical protein